MAQQTAGVTATCLLFPQPPQDVPLTVVTTLWQKSTPFTPHGTTFDSRHVGGHCHVV